ncbi:putative translation elongation factor EF1B, beta/delta chains [Helianthus anomalus]
MIPVDTLIEERLTEKPINEYVQSCDIVAFNKILHQWWTGCYCETWRLIFYFVEIHFGGVKMMLIARTLLEELFC